MEISNLSTPQKLQIVEKLRQQFTPKRVARLQEVVANRTNLIKMVIEDVRYDRNAGAVLRTCDCFGVQNATVIENKYVTKVSNIISKGSEKWLHVEKYERDPEKSTIDALTKMKNDGFTIVATTPHSPDVELDDFEISGKTAFLFGTEESGLSKQALDMADVRLKVPIYGFTESYNISVTAALVLQSVVSKMRKSNLNWKLSSEEQLDLEIEWLLTSLKRHSDEKVAKIKDELGISNLI